MITVSPCEPAVAESKLGNLHIRGRSWNTLRGGEGSGLYIARGPRLPASAGNRILLPAWRSVPPPRLPWMPGRTWSLLLRLCVGRQSWWVPLAGPHHHRVLGLLGALGNSLGPSVLRWGSLFQRRLRLVSACNLFLPVWHDVARFHSRRGWLE